jgi:hypothetical protein
MFGNGQYVIPAKAGIQIPVWTLCQWQIMPSAKIYYDWYNISAAVAPADNPDGKFVPAFD